MWEPLIKKRENEEALLKYLVKNNPTPNPELRTQVK